MEISEELITEVYEILKEEAKAGRSISYFALDEMISQDFGPRLQGLFPILNEICRREVKAGRGMLSAVVVRKGRDDPGEGFYRLAAELYKKDIDDEEGFFIEEREKVWSYWGKN